jgi:hypothetical protein
MSIWPDCNNDMTRPNTWAWVRGQDAFPMHGALLLGTSTNRNRRTELASPSRPGKTEMTLIRLLSTPAHLPKFVFRRSW